MWPAAAEQSQASTWCVRKDTQAISADLSISGCTTVIQSGNETQENLAFTFNNRGSAYYDKGDNDRAIQDYDQAIRLKPDDASAYYRRGSVRGFLGDNVRAIDDFSKGIELNPKLGSAYSLRGYSRGVLGQYDLAERDQQIALELAKNEKWENYQAWVLQSYADLWRRRRDFEKALTYCEKALLLKPYALVYFRRAWIYLDMGRHAEAKADFDTFAQEMERQGIQYTVFWPDERGALARLRELR